MRLFFVAFCCLFSLSACDRIQQRLGWEDTAAKAAKDEADGRAVGGACRHSGRAIEDCYAIYHWLPKAAVFAGWQEMDEYMRTNKIETVEPQLPPAAAPEDPKKKRAKKNAEGAENPADTASEDASATSAQTPAASAPANSPAIPSNTPNNAPNAPPGKAG